MEAGVRHAAFRKPNRSQKLKLWPLAAVWHITECEYESLTENCKGDVRRISKSKRIGVAGPFKTKS